MASIQLTVKQLAAICTGATTPPWTLKIQPNQSTKSVSLRSLIAQVSESEVIVFANLRNGTIFENYPGVISDYVQAYIFNRTCLSADDLTNLITALTQNNLSLVYVSPTMQTVGIRGTIGNLNAMRLYSLGEITSVGDELTSSASTGEAGQTQAQAFWQKGQLFGGLLAGAGASVSKVAYGLLHAKANSTVVPASVYGVANSTTGNSVAATAAADSAAVTGAEAALGDTLSGATVSTLEVVGGAEATGEIGLLVYASLGVGLFVGLAALGVGVGILIYATYKYYEPPVSTPVNAQPQAPTNIAPQNVPQGQPIIPPVITTPPTVGPQPIELNPALISSTPYTTDTVALNGFPGGLDVNNPLFPNSYSALTANGGAAYLANPWQILSNLVSELPNLQKGTGPAWVGEQLGNTDPNTGENFLQNRITNPANGQVITISGPSNLGQASSTVLISDSVANKTQTTTTNITVDSTTGSAQIEVTQSVGAYAPTSWPPEASAGGGGGGTYFGAGTGGGTGTATGTDGTDGTVGTDGTDGTDGTNGTGSTGSIIGGTGVGVG